MAYSGSARRLSAPGRATTYSPVRRDREVSGAWLVEALPQVVRGFQLVPQPPIAAFGDHTDSRQLPDRSTAADLDPHINRPVLATE
jgi:hypothetical protein